LGLPTHPVPGGSYSSPIDIGLMPPGTVPNMLILSKLTNRIRSTHSRFQGHPPVTQSSNWKSGTPFNDRNRPHTATETTQTLKVNGTLSPPPDLSYHLSAEACNRLANLMKKMYVSAPKSDIISLANVSTDPYQNAQNWTTEL